jgi:hypothetical protein
MRIVHGISLDQKLFPPEALMLYILRLSTGDCIVVEAQDQSIARDMALAYGLEEGESVVSVRSLSRFAARFSPNDSASLDASSWEDATLDDILAHEYPALNEAFHHANSLPLMEAPSTNREIVTQLKEAYQQNLEIIRKGLRSELERFTPEPARKQQTTGT